MSNQPQNSDLSEVKQAIKEGLIRAWHNNFLGNLAEYDSRSILTIFPIICCWGWDAMIRLSPISDDMEVSEDPASWELVCREANKRMEELTLESLAKAFLEGLDGPPVICLGQLAMMGRSVGKEIMKRIEPLKVGKQLLYALDRNPSFDYEEFIQSVKPPTRLVVQGKQIPLSRTEEKWKGRTKREIGLDEQATNLIFVFDYYQRLKEEIQSDSLMNIPIDPMATFLPAINPLWQKAAPRIMCEQIQAWVDLIPILERKMEWATFNEYRNNYRNEIKFNVLLGSIPDSATETDEDSKYIQEQRKIASKVHYDEEQRQFIDADPGEEIQTNKVKKKISVQLELALKSSTKITRPKIREAIILKLSDNTLTDNKIAEKNGIDSKTLRHYWRELRSMVDDDPFLAQIRVELGLPSHTSPSKKHQ
ncbi:MAG: hypothetical protein IH857_00265 [Deltaproteobacteria bacterium]|nr:hypothetical protein [Deltaproteobacteria bacterium]